MTIGGLRYKRTNGDYSNYCISDIGQNTEKSPGDLRRLAVTQASMKDHQLKLMWITLKEIIKMIKGTYQKMDFTVPAHHRVNLEENERRDKYLDFGREVKKLWNMKVTVIRIVIDVHGMVSKGLVQWLYDLEIRGRVETIQITALLRSARISRGALETWQDLLSLRLQWKTISRCEKLYNTYSYCNN